MNPEDISDPKYRYTLRRTLDEGGDSVLCWVMCNPSTADDLVDDPTIRRVISFTGFEHYESLVVVNLFAARSTKPKHLLEMDDPVGPRNLSAIEDAFDEAMDIVFAWGAWPSTTRLVRPPVEEIAKDMGHMPKCLGWSQGRQPLHPLYIPNSRTFEVYG